jgi:hypothetical protein
LLPFRKIGGVGGAGTKAPMTTTTTTTTTNTNTNTNTDTHAATTPAAPAPSSLPVPTFALPLKTPVAAPGGGQEDPQYEMSPYRSDSEDEDEEGAARRAAKAIPGWARSVSLIPTLQQQMRVDPDRIFNCRPGTCELEAIFDYQAFHAAVASGDEELKKKFRKKRDPSRRTSSGCWTGDTVTAHEIRAYAKTLGLIS